MGYAELIQQRLQTLSPDKQAEVYDFVEFIATRNPRPSPVDWTNEEFSRLSMTEALRGLENDPVDYALADVKERWQ
ncbi:MAG: hypothetical protein CFE43_19465 [Burkholderiales bacterium PBB3]|nr:MAG: hypothetical protein CFE43_19465 [Burkholderiales bacterium PBB3]